MDKGLFLKKLAATGEGHHLAKRWDQALDMYDLALTQDDEDNVHAHILYLIGSMYSEHNKNGLAKFFLEEALKVLDLPEAWNNLGIVYKSINRYDKAKECYAAALRKDYNPLTLANLSGLHINVAEPEKAFEIASKAYALHPYPQAGNHMALASLEMCKWEQGFTLYEHRREIPEYVKRDYECPQWDGGKIGKLIVHGEQGLGDEIMFMSTWPLFKHLADEIVIECAKRLVPLFERTFGVRCMATLKEVKESGYKPDAFIPMGSLPLATKLWGHWEDRKFPFLKVGEPYPRNGFRLGFSWRGGTNKTHDVFRNFSLSEWKDLVALPGDHISVQYGPAEGMAKSLGLPHDTEAIADFDKLVSMVASCDAVVTVCNTSVHIAGALDVPCYVLTPHKKAWRYATETERMKWYRSVVLIQQAEDEPWSSVVQRAKERLCADFPELSRIESAVARNAA